MRRRSLFILVLAAIVVLGGGAYAAERYAKNEPVVGAGHFLGPNPVITTTQASPTPTPTPTPTEPVVTLRAPADPSDITVTGTSLFGWAFYDRRTDETVGSKNYTTVHNTTESMIKPWIAGDYLRRLAASGQTPTKTALNELTLMLIDSNDVMAQKYYAMDGHNAVLDRFIKTCGLKSVTYRSGWWSYTNITPADAIRYAQCIADGRVAGPKWTAWLLATMKKPRGGVKDQISTQKEGGHWGVIDGLPDDLKTTISWKNGWTYQFDATWHINCMAISPDWMLVVEMHTTSLQKGADICASVTQQLVVTE